MKSGLFSEISSGGKLLIFFILALGSFFLFSTIGIVSGIIELEIEPDLFNSDATVFKMKLSQIIQAVGLFIVPSITAAYLFKKANENYLETYKPNLHILILSTLLIFFALPLINWLGMINNQIQLPDFMSSIDNWLRSKEDSAGTLMDRFLKAPDLNTLALNLTVMAIIPAIGEEFLFRGILQKLLIKMNKNVHLGIWITAFVFSAVHMQFFTFFPRLFLGALLGYLFVWSKSIWVPILVHFINNALAIILHYLIEHKKIGQDIETIGANDNLTFPIVSLVLTGLTIYSIYKLKDRQRSY